MEALAKLDSKNSQESLRGLADLTDLVEGAQADAAARLAEEIRSTGTVGLLAAFIEEKDVAVHLRALIILANILSNAFEPNAALTRAIVRAYRIPARVARHLKSDDTMTVLYSVALLQNACSDPIIARQATEEKVARRGLERLLESPDARIAHYAAGALTNMRGVVEADVGPQPLGKKSAWQRFIFSGRAGVPQRVSITAKSEQLLARFGEKDLLAPVHAAQEPHTHQPKSTSPPSSDASSEHQAALASARKSPPAIGNGQDAHMRTQGREDWAVKPRNEAQERMTRQHQGQEWAALETSSAPGYMAASAPVHARSVSGMTHSLTSEPVMVGPVTHLSIAHSHEPAAAGANIGSSAALEAPADWGETSAISALKNMLHNSCSSSSERQPQGGIKGTNFGTPTSLELLNVESTTDAPTDGNSAKASDAAEALDVLPALGARLLSSDETVVDDALAILGELVGEAYGEDGLRLGEKLRSLNIIMSASLLLASPSNAIVKQALVILGNLTSDAVDPRCALTKIVLLQAGAEFRLLPLLSSTDEAVLVYTCAVLLNLCKDSAWSATLGRQGTVARLQLLVQHSNPDVSRYAAGILRNIQIQVTANIGVASAAATTKMARRAVQARANALRRRNAARKIERARRAQLHARGGAVGAEEKARRVQQLYAETDELLHPYAALQARTGAPLVQPMPPPNAAEHPLRTARERARQAREERRREYHCEKLRTFIASRAIQRGWRREALHDGPPANPFWLRKGSQRHAFTPQLSPPPSRPPRPSSKPSRIASRPASQGNKSIAQSETRLFEGSMGLDASSSTSNVETRLVSDSHLGPAGVHGHANATPYSSDAPIGAQESNMAAATQEQRDLPRNAQATIAEQPTAANIESLGSSSDLATKMLGEKAKTPDADYAHKPERKAPATAGPPGGNEGSAISTARIVSRDGTRVMDTWNTPSRDPSASVVVAHEGDDDTLSDFAGADELEYAMKVLEDSEAALTLARAASLAAVEAATAAAAAEAEASQAFEEQGEAEFPFNEAATQVDIPAPALDISATPGAGTKAVTAASSADANPAAAESTELKAAVEGEAGGASALAAEMLVAAVAEADSAAVAMPGDEAVAASATEAEGAGVAAVIAEGLAAAEVLVGKTPAMAADSELSAAATTEAEVARTAMKAKATAMADAAKAEAEAEVLGAAEAEEVVAAHIEVAAAAAAATAAKTQVAEAEVARVVAGAAAASQIHVAGMVAVTAEVAATTAAVGARMAAAAVANALHQVPQAVAAEVGATAAAKAVSLSLDIEAAIEAQHREKAAVAIQSIARGRWSREMHKRLLDAQLVEEAERRARAATVVQTRSRGRRARRATQHLREEEAEAAATAVAATAAVAVQRRVRGILARRAVVKIKELKVIEAAAIAQAATMARAATVLQARARVHIAMNVARETTRLRAKAEVAAKLAAEERARATEAAVLMIQRYARRREGVRVAQAERAALRSQRAAIAVQKYARARAARQLAADIRETRRPREVGAAIAMQPAAEGEVYDGQPAHSSPVRLMLRIKSADETEEAMCARRIESERDAAKRFEAECAHKQAIERRAEIVFSQARLRNEMIAERLRAEAAAAEAAAQREAELRAEEEARQRKEAQRIERERHYATLAIQVRVRAKRRHRDFLERRRLAAERNRMERIQQLMYLAVVTKIQRHFRCVLKWRLQQKLEAASRLLQRYARGWLARLRRVRIRMREARRRKHLEMRARVHLGRSDVTRAIGWSSYARVKTSKAVAEEQFTRFGELDGVRAARVSRPLSPRGPLGDGSFPHSMHPLQREAGELGSRSRLDLAYTYNAVPTFDYARERSELMRLIKSERVAATTRPYEQSLGGRKLREAGLKLPPIAMRLPPHGAVGARKWSGDPAATRGPATARRSGVGDGTSASSKPKTQQPVQSYPVPPQAAWQ